MEPSEDLKALLREGADACAVQYPRDGEPAPSWQCARFRAIQEGVSLGLLYLVDFYNAAGLAVTNRERDRGKDRAIWGYTTAGMEWVVSDAVAHAPLP